ncbi:MAG TPA: cytochrome c nitrite reductase small subunit [Phycisphaerales bacterium]|nr:cytochrome c nitrite reductase small subunit [Phycisphaerales bacterium]
MAAQKTPSRTRAALIVTALIGVFVGLAAATFDYAEGTSYLSNDPNACVNCHIMRDQFNSWQLSAHHAHATCNDCHVPHDLVGKYVTKMDHGYRHSKGFTFNDFHEPIQIKESSLRVVENNCVRCHGSFVGDLTIAHAALVGDKVEPRACSRCHASAGHAARR